MALHVGFSSGSRALPAVLVGTVVMALFVPMRWQGWVTALGGLTQTLVAPVSGPVTHLVRWVAPASPPRPADEHYASLEQENQQLRTQVFAQTQENQRLREQLAQLRVVVPSTHANVDYLPTQVVGASSDLAGQAIILRAGSRDGVQIGDTVTTDFVQVLGRVASVTPRTCTVLPITADKAEDFEAVILSTPSTMRCRLAPIGGGLLRGDLEDKRDAQSGKPLEPKVGDEVRLSDPTRWPASAQMLVIGTVQSIDQSPKQPLRKCVVVRPTVPDLSKVAEAVLRVAPGSARQASATGKEGNP